MFDLVIRGGSVLDGTGGPALTADVAVLNGRIAALIERPPPAGSPAGSPAEPSGASHSVSAPRDIDATGRYVTPGFVDAHVHADAAGFDPRMQQAALGRGVTPVVLGQDGLSFAPGSPARCGVAGAGKTTVEFVNRYFAAVNGTHPLLEPGGWSSVAGLLDGARPGRGLRA